MKVLGWLACCVMPIRFNQQSERHAAAILSGRTSDALYVCSTVLWGVDLHFAAHGRVLFADRRFAAWRIAPRIPFLTGYEYIVILESMKIGERGQVTIPKDIRDQFGLGPETEVDFRVVGGSIILKKAPKKLNLAKWKGRCGDAFAKLGYSSVDKFIDDVRGR